MCKKKGCTGAVSSKGSKGNDGTDGEDALFGGFSSKWSFDDSNSSNPNVRTLRLNNSDPTLATEIYVNETNFGSIDLADFLHSFSNSGAFGFIRLFKEYDSSVFHYYRVTNNASSTGVATLTVTYIDGNGVFANKDDLVLTFTPKGTTGSNGTNGTNGTNAFKFIKDITSLGDGETKTITHAEIIAAHAIPSGDYGSGTSYDQYFDFQIDIYQYIVGVASPDKWRKIDNNTSAGTGGVYIDILASGPNIGDVVLTFDFAPVEDPITYKVIILA